jgi:integrase
MTDQVRGQRRARRPILTDNMVADLLRKPGFHPDPELPKHGIRVRQPGAGAYYIVTRDPQRDQRWVKIGSTAEMEIEEARDKARTVIKRIEAGLSPREAPPVQPDTVADVVENFLKRHVEKNGLRTAGEVERILRTYVLPRWADRPFAALKRSDIAKLLDDIEDKHGPWTADAVLAQLRSVASWFASRNDDYVLPFVRGMRRTPQHARARARVLNDDELRAVWKAAEQAGVFGGLVRMLLLTGQRRDKCAAMRWDDIASDGVWTIRSEAREKGNAGALKLPPLALATIKAMPRLVSNPHIFAGKGGGATANFSADKARLDKASGVTGYTLHDLRRVAKTLMARAEVRRDISERVLGHAIKGVEGVYDRHEYDSEKADALNRLAALIGRIVNPPAGDKVVPLRGAAAS